MPAVRLQAPRWIPVPELRHVRGEGMSTRLTGHVITYLEAKVQLTADDIGFVMTVTKDMGTAWKFNLSQMGPERAYRNYRVAIGRVLAPDHQTALRLAASIAGAGYEPGTVERKLFDALTSP
jgi:hypothetical protein